MRILIVLALGALGCSGDQSCPDLSGTYLLNVAEGEVRITMRQDKCATMTLETLEPMPADSSDTFPERHVLHLDGMAHPDSGWLGGYSQQHTTAQFLGDSLRVVVRFGPGINANVVTWIYHLTNNKDLSIKVRNNQGSNPPIEVARRMM